MTPEFTFYLILIGGAICALVAVFAAVSALMAESRRAREIVPQYRIRVTATEAGWLRTVEPIEADEPK